MLVFICLPEIWANMGRMLEFRPDDSHVEQVAAEADDLGVSRATYVQMMFEAGRRLFQASGKLDTDMLADLVDEGDHAFQSEKDLAEIENDISDEILIKLPSDPNRAASTEEVREMVFGTREEQMEVTEEALKQLYNQGKIESAFDGGYYSDK
jgi:hypothetical protein